MNFGEYLKEIRRENKLSQRKLAELADISNTEISRLESGERQKPSPSILKAIAPHLGTSYSALMKKAGYIEETISDGLFKESLINDPLVTHQDIVSAASVIEHRDPEMLSLLKRATTDLPDEDMKIIKDLVKLLLGKI